ncbi:Kelch repeat-containing protein [Planctomycetota bacterium]
MIAKQKSNNHPRFMVCLLVMSATCAYGASSTTPPISDQWRWETLECHGKPIGRHETAFVEVDGFFYLIGGREAKGNIERFDPKTNTWTVMKAKSPLIHHFQPVLWDGKIWMMGAMTGNYPKEPPMKNIQIYDPKQDVWSEGSEMPEARRRGSAGTVVYNGKIYMACGITLGHTSGTNAWFDEYDPKTNTWKQLPDAPNIRDHFHAVVLDDKLYCIGGRNTSYHEPGNFGAFFGAVTKAVDVYDFKAGTWSTLDGPAVMPIGSAAGGTAVLNGCIVYFGGETAETALNNCWTFNPTTKNWTDMAPLNQGRHGSQAIVYENKIYIAAGSPKRGGGNVDSIEAFSMPN